MPEDSNNTVLKTHSLRFYSCTLTRLLIAADERKAEKYKALTLSNPVSRLGIIEQFCQNEMNCSALEISINYLSSCQKQNYQNNDARN
jgi:hypothetical protein